MDEPSANMLRMSFRLLSGSLFMPESMLYAWLVIKHFMQVL